MVQFAALHFEQEFLQISISTIVYTCLIMLLNLDSTKSRFDSMGVPQNAGHLDQMRLDPFDLHVDLGVSPNVLHTETLCGIF